MLRDKGSSLPATAVPTAVLSPSTPAVLATPAVFTTPTPVVLGLLVVVLWRWLRPDSVGWLRVMMNLSWRCLVVWLWVPSVVLLPLLRVLAPPIPPSSMLALAVPPTAPSSDVLAFVTPALVALD